MTTRLFVTRAALLLSGLAALQGCGSDADDAYQLRITVLDGATQQPVGGALVAMEPGGIYLENPDLTRGNPSYARGAKADASGVFDLVDLPDGLVGLHVFADGYRYGPRKVTVDSGAQDTKTIELAKELAEDAQPVVSTFELTPAEVAPGGDVTVKATVAAGAVTDPTLAAVAKLSEEVLVIAPEAGLCLALDPPSPGCSIGEDPANPRGCPDGEYTRTFAAPTEAGTYTYALVVSSEGCVTSDRRELTLTVR